MWSRNDSCVGVAPGARLVDIGNKALSPAVSEDRRRARARHIWLVLEEVKRETVQPADLETVEAAGLPRWPGWAPTSPQLADGRAGRSRAG